MKAYRKIISGIAVTAVMLTSTCTRIRQDGSMVIQMTDAPDPVYTEVNIDVRSMEVHYNDQRQGNAGWITLKTKAGVYDLLKLQSNVLAVLADDDAMPLGKVTQVRMVLGDQNTIESGGVVYPLNVASASQTGIKVNVDAEIHLDKTTGIVLDFDAKKSIVLDGNGSFSLKPVIEVKSITQF